MGRLPRDWIPGASYHVFSRGSNRHELFLADSERVELLEHAAVVVERYGLDCYAFALMTNHCHWLFRVPEDPVDALSRALRDLNGTHARRFNRRHGREAHAFRNRFGAVLQETEGQFLWTARYIVRNPLDAGLCERVGDWPWSSYRATAGLAAPPPFLRVDSLLAFFAPTRAAARVAYAGFVERPRPDTSVSVS